jgi:hypothetical protein
MVKVLNKLRQPLVINIVDGEDIHFLSREEKELTEEQFNSKRVQKYVDLEDLIVLSVD